MKLKRGQRYADWKERCEKFPEYYHKLHPDWTEKQCKDAATYFCRSINWQCPEYYKKDNPNLTDDECHILIKQKQLEKKKNYKQCIEYYQYHFPEATLEEQKEMLEQYKKSYLNKRSNNFGVNNPAHHSKTTELQRRQRSPMCIEFYQLKYPDLSIEEQQLLLSKHKELIREKLHDKTTQIRCVEYWINKGYTENEARKIISQQTGTFTLEKCIEKYGVEEGTKRFNERQIKWQKSLHNSLKNNATNGKTQSKFANSIIKVLKDFYKGEKEFIVDRYSFDYRYKNKLIEFNGDYWHMNPLIFSKDDINKTTKMTAQQIWDKDNEKRMTAELNNYQLLIIWESEYYNDVSGVIKKCMEFLNE